MHMDSGLKKRLIGALVLIVLAIIFVPMLLPSHSGSDGVDLKIPPPPSGEMQTRTLQVGPGSASAGSSTAAALRDPNHLATVDLNAHPAPAAPLPGASASVSSVAAASAPAASAAARPVAAAPVAPPAASAAAQSARSSTAARGTLPAAAPASSEPLAGGAGAAAGAAYTVNLGIYADHASANRLVANARQQGFTAVATPATFQGKSVLRVRVGPFGSRAAAEAARLKLKGVERVSMTIEAAAVNQTGNAPATAIPAGKPGAWAVQLAAYRDQSSADKLRDRLRAQGFDGYVDSITTSAGTLWRVRAGPFVSRDVAESTRGEIAQKLKVQGNIVTQQ